MANTVTIVAWQALPAVFPDEGRNIGGLETAAWQFATGLAGRTDWNVQFVVRADHNRQDTVVDGVRVISVTDRWLAIRRNVAKCIDVPARRITRFQISLFWQVPLLAVTWPWRSRDVTGFSADPRLSSIESDVWIAMGVSRESAAVVSTATVQAKPSLLMIQSAADLSEAFAAGTSQTLSPYGESPAACRQAIEQATVIVCQAAYQQRLLQSRFGREGALVRNAIDLEHWRAAADNAAKQDPYVLWIGRFETFHKRIDQAIEIARRCPQIPFRLVANSSDDDVERSVRASLPDNVTLLEYVPHDQMPAMFAGAGVFLSTGAAQYEGFPNVLLQAAATNTPIVSLEDFDAFIETAGSGIVVGANHDRAADAISEIFDGKRTIDHQSVRAYLEQHHSRPKVIEQLTEVMRAIV